MISTPERFMTLEYRQFREGAPNMIQWHKSDKDLMTLLAQNHLIDMQSPV